MPTEMNFGKTRIGLGTMAMSACFGAVSDSGALKTTRAFGDSGRSGVNADDLVAIDMAFPVDAVAGDR